jgi:hypothetical protein
MLLVLLAFWRMAIAIPMVTVLLLLTLLIAACGGGGTTPPPPPPRSGTPAGCYTVTVTATSGNLTHTTTLTLIVQ